MSMGPRGQQRKGDDMTQRLEMTRRKKIMDHVNTMYGYHGGTGDPPDEDTILAIIRGTLEYVEEPTPGERIIQGAEEALEYARRENESVYIEFDGAPGPDGPRFVEVHDANGKGLNTNGGWDWEPTTDGYYRLGPFYARPKEESVATRCTTPFKQETPEAHPDMHCLAKNKNPLYWGGPAGVVVPLGTIGTVVAVYAEGDAYEVEFPQDPTLTFTIDAKDLEILRAPHEVVTCADCGVEPPDHPDTLCPGCRAYKEHTE